MKTPDAYFNTKMTHGILLLILLICIQGCVYHKQAPNLINQNNITFLSIKQYKTIKVEKIVSVYDGDTFKCDLKGNIPDLFGKSILVRINGVDTPEIKGDIVNHELAIKAQEFTFKMLSNGKKIELRNPQRDKYFRILADVYIDNVKLSDELLKNGLAKEYHGESKEGIWD